MDPIRTKPYVGDRDAFFRTFWRLDYWLRVPLVLATFGLISYFAFGPLWIYALLGFASTILVLVVVRYGYLRRAVYGKANAAFYEASRTWEIGDEGIHAVVADGAETRTPWPYYARAFRGKTGTFLRHKAGTTAYAPDDAFETRADLERFLALLRDKGLQKR